MPSLGVAAARRFMRHKSCGGEVAAISTEFHRYQQQTPIVQFDKIAFTFARQLRSTLADGYDRFNSLLAITRSVHDMLRYSPA